MTRWLWALWLALWLIPSALILGLLFSAPVMREPSGTISATAYFGAAK